jgi:hypothetical protein
MEASAEPFIPGKTKSHTNHRPLPTVHFFRSSKKTNSKNESTFPPLSLMPYPLSLFHSFLKKSEFEKRTALHYPLHSFLEKNEFEKRIHLSALIPYALSPIPFPFVPRKKLIRKTNPPPATDLQLASCNLQP